MAYSLLSHTIGSGSNTFTTSAIDTTGATLITVGASFTAGASVTLSDTVGGNSNSWTARTSYGSVSAARIYYSVPTHVGSGHTFTLTGTGFNGDISVAAWSGAAGTPYDVENGFDGGGSNATSGQPGSITPTQDNELVVTVLTNGVTSGSYTINGSYSITDQTLSSGAHWGSGFAYWIQTSATATNPTWSANSGCCWSIAIASFKALAATANGSFAGFFQ